MFLANYGDGLSDVDLPAMIEKFQRTRRGRIPAAGAADRELRYRARATPGAVRLKSGR